MTVINRYYIKDVICLSEQVSVSDSRGVHVEYLEISITRSKQQFMTHSQYFEYTGLSVNDCDKHEWLSDGRDHFKNMKLPIST